MMPRPELRSSAFLALAAVACTALAVMVLEQSPAALLQKKQLHQELQHIARTTALIDEPTDVADGNLYKDPKKEAKLGTVHSDDLFAAGMREAKAGEQRFEQAVAKEKMKAVKSELASLRKSLPKSHQPHSAVGRAQDEWSRLEATAGRIAGEAASAEGHLARRKAPLSLRHASLHALGLEDEHVPHAVDPLGHSLRRHTAARRHAAHRQMKGHRSGTKAAAARGREHSAGAEVHAVAAEEAEVKAMREANARLRAQIRSVRGRIGAQRKAATTQLEEEDELAIRHQHRVIHQTRPGEVGGITCAPPFCNSDSLPAILPGEEP